MNAWKTLTLIVLNCLIWHVSFAQKCKWDEQKVDDFSGSKYLKAKKVQINQEGHKAGQAQSYGIFVLELKDSKVLLNINHRRGGTMSGTDRVVAPVLNIKEKSGDVIKVASEESFPVQIFIGATEVDFIFELTKDAVSKAAAGITAFRLTFEGKDYDFKPSDKQVEKLANQLACLQKQY